MEPDVKKNYNKTIIISGIVAAIAVGIGMIVYSSTPAQRLKRQIDLGNRYLSELRYEEAVAAFEAALEIDPNSFPAHYGVVNATIGTGDMTAAQTRFESAIGVVENVMKSDEGMTDLEINRNTDDAAAIILMAGEVYPGKVEAVVRILEEGYILLSENGEIRLALLVYYEEIMEDLSKNRKYEEALEIYIRVLELRTDGDDTKCCGEIAHSCVENLLKRAEVDEERMKELIRLWRENVPGNDYEASAIIILEKMMKSTLDKEETDSAREILQGWRDYISNETYITFVEEIDKKEEELYELIRLQLERVYQMMQAKNYYGIASAKLLDVPYVTETRRIVSRIKGEKMLYDPQKGIVDTLDGIGLGLYKYDHFDETGFFYYYYGPYVKGVRVGDGVAITGWTATEGTISYDVFSGNWSDDYPNGKGKNTRRKTGGEFGDESETISGAYINGLQDGMMTITHNGKSITYRANKGIPDVSENVVNKYRETFQENAEEGVKLYAYIDHGSRMAGYTYYHDIHFYSTYNKVGFLMGLWYKAD